MERELWKALYWLATQLDKRWGSWKYTTAEIVAVYFWAVVHDRPTSWAAEPDQWPEDVRPVWLPSQSTLSRRLQHADSVDLMTAVEQHLIALLGLGQGLVHVIDGKALGVSGVSKDPDAGWGRGAGQWQKGYKLHGIYNGGPMMTTWALAAMNVSEKTMAKKLFSSLPGGGYLLGDSQYDAAILYDAAHKEGFQLMAKKRASRGRDQLGHRRQSPARLRSIELLTTNFGRQVYAQRAAIERMFGVQVSTGGGLSPLPAWVRRFPRVRHWFQAKHILSGLRWIKINEPIMLAFA